MPKLKLTYFDFHGGRGEPAQLALSMGGISFEDDRLPPSDWQRRKPDTPFGALPVLEVDGQTLAESNAINRYVGKLTDLYPLDAWQAALCDEVMEAVEDINTRPKYDEPKTARDDYEGTTGQQRLCDIAHS